MIKISKKSLGLILRKGTAIFVCSVFLATSVYLPQAKAEMSLLPAAGFHSLTDNLTAIALPTEIGKIRETYRGSGDKVVVLVQDAHSIPDAQRSIRSVIDYFQTQYGVSLVGLEGASDKLDPQIFRSFPDKELLQKTFDAYATRGELMGGTAAALFNSSPCIYQGIEAWPLYEEGVSYYLQAMKMEPEINSILDPMEAALTREKESVYSNELLEIDRLLADFGRNKTDLVQVLNKLSQYHPPPKGSELAVLLEEIQQSQMPDTPVEIEIKKIADQVLSSLKNQPLDPETRQELQEFNGNFQEFRTARTTPQAFAFYLKGVAKKHGVLVKVSHKLTYLTEHQKRLKDIEGTRLFEDFKRYSDSVKESLFQNDQQKALDIKTRELDLIKRLARLELSFEDWGKVQQMILQLDRWAITQDQVVSREDVSSLVKKMEPHLAFYRIAEKRDKVFLENIRSMMEMAKQESSLLVAGGFHAEGLTRELKDKGISYVLVMPQIGSIPEEPLYREHMQGQVSWSKYFEVKNGKVNLYDAFVRAARDKLLEDKAASAIGRKEWRDQIIRDLAADGRITQASEYTRFIDETNQLSSPRAQSQREKWLANIDRFGEGLKKLQTEGNLSESSILQLIKTITTAELVSMPLANRSVDVKLLPSISAVSPAPQQIKSLKSGRSEIRFAPASPFMDQQQLFQAQVAFQELLGSVDSLEKISAITPNEIAIGRYSFQLVQDSGTGDWVIKIADFGTPENAIRATNQFVELGALLVDRSRLEDIALTKHLYKILAVGQQLLAADSALINNPAGLAREFQRVVIALRDHTASGVSPPAQSNQPTTTPSVRGPTLDEALNFYARLRKMDADGPRAQKQLGQLSPYERLKLTTQMALGIEHEPTREQMEAFTGSTIGVRKVSEFPGLDILLKQLNIKDHYAGYVEIDEKALHFMRRTGAFQTASSKGAMNDAGKYGPFFLQGNETNYFRELGSYVYLRNEFRSAFHESFHHRAGGKTDYPFVFRTSTDDMNGLEEMQSYLGMNLRADGSIDERFPFGSIDQVEGYMNSEAKRSESRAAVQVVRRLVGIFPGRDVIHEVGRARSFADIIEMGRLSDQELVDLIRPGFTVEELAIARQVGYDPRQKAVVELHQEALAREYLRHLENPSPQNIQSWANQWADPRVRYLVQMGGRSELRLVAEWLDSIDEHLTLAVSGALGVMGISAQSIRDRLKALESGIDKGQPSRQEVRNGPFGKNILVPGRAETRELNKYLRINEKSGQITHQNRNVNFTLPASRFGGHDVNPVEVFGKVAAEILGEEPLVSVMGSLTYALTAQGTPDWDNVDDLDIRIHTKTPISEEQKWKIKRAFYDALSQEYGLRLGPVRMASGRLPPRSPTLDIDEQISEIDSPKQHPIQLIFSSAEHLFGNEANLDFGVYRMTDCFFGNTELLNSLLTAQGQENILRKNADYYMAMLNQIKNGQSPFAKPLKSLYFLATMRGRQAEFKWLMDSYAELEAQFNPEKIKESYDKAIAALDVNDETSKAKLYSDLRSLIVRQEVRSEQRVVSQPTVEALATVLKPGVEGVSPLNPTELREVEALVAQGKLEELTDLLRETAKALMDKAEASVNASATTVKVTKEMAEIMVKNILTALETNGIKGNLTIGFDVSPDKNFMEALQSVKDGIGTAVFTKDVARKLDRTVLEGVTIQTVGSLKSYKPLAAENAGAVPVLSQNLEADYFSNEALFGVGLDAGKIQGEPFLEIAENVVRIAVGLLKADLMTKGLKPAEINAKLLEILFKLDVGSSHGVISMSGRHLIVHREALQQIMLEYQATSEVKKAA